MRKTNPLTKLRFESQVSAAFASVSILIDADAVCPQDPRAIAVPHSYKSCIQVYSNVQASSITEDRQSVLQVSSNIRNRIVFWMMFELCYEKAYNYRFVPGSWCKLHETNDLRFHEWEVQWLICSYSL
jgi:hypothetical protein